MIHHVYVFHSVNMCEWKNSDRDLVAKLTLDIPIIVETEEILRLAFQKTNSIDHRWEESPEVIAYAKNIRSTSVGDLFALVDDKKFIVNSFGFTEVETIFGFNKVTTN